MDSLKEKIEQSDVISFDIFDTLVCRKVSEPSDVFSLVEIWYNKEHNEKISDFRATRIEAERSCRKNGGREITLEQIYENLFLRYGESVGELKDIEKSIEKDVSYRRTDIYRLYQYAVRKKKKVLLISDMYLPQKIIEQILEKNHIRNYRALYVSSESGYKKNDGSLYRLIRKTERLGVESRWLHFGDNIKSDVLQAGRYGIHPVLVKKKNRYRNNNQMPKKEYGSARERFGYNILGPLMFGYSVWLHEMFIENGIKKVFFFSREGYFIQKCCEKLFDGSDICSGYLYVSRKSLLQPILGEPDIIGKLENFRPVGNKNAYEYLSSLGIYGGDAENFLRKNGLSKGSNAGKIVRIKNRLSKILKENGKNTLGMLTAYLAQEGVNGKFAIVDVGWTGTMQIALNKVLDMVGIWHETYGFFMGQHSEMKEFARFGIRNKGWLCGYDGPKSIQNFLLSGNCLLELLLMAPHGTTAGYKKDREGKVIPVLEINEFSKTYGVIEEIQKAALEFVHDCRFMMNDGTKRNPCDYFENLKKFLSNPDAEFVGIFGDMEFNDSGLRKIAPVCRSRNPIKQIQGYYRSFWKIGYLKRNVPIRLPYISFYILTRSIAKRIKGK